MAWKKHFTVYQTKNKSSGNAKDGFNNRFQSWLPEVYTGMPNRVERYMQYDQMDMDSEINMALDTIAEFATQIDEKTASPFQINYKSNPTESEAKIIEQSLKQWCNINDWDRRIFRTFRNVIKYGDQPFIRDPETWELLYINPQDVIGVVINESEGKDPEQYILKNLDLNIRDKTASTPLSVNKTTGGVSPSTFTQPTRQTVNTTYSQQLAFGTNEETYVNANNMVHIAMTEGMDSNYPFGSSILDPIFKTYKQKELLEDAIIIYRVQRAPERRVFYIDTGDMPPHRANAFLERVKMEVHQKRIPNKTGGGSTIMDAQYSPLSMLEDYFFSQSCLSLDTKIPLLDGRTLSLNDIINEYSQGKENWVYGLSNVTHELEPAKIKWAGVTRKDATVLKIVLDNGESVIATPDHKFILRDGTEVESQYLNIGDSLMPLNLKKQLENIVIEIVDIIELDYTIDTGDITIESESNSHWFGLGAGIYVHNSDGRGSKVEVLPGGDNLGEISDLQFFTDKMMRGLRIPSSYMPMAHDDSGPNFTDGRVGTSFIQEFRFNKYCMRLQNIIQPTFDREFKRFMKHRGFNIDSSIFDLRFGEPQSFSDYRQIELDSAKAGVFGQVEGTPYLSRRFILKRYLGLTDDEILENERLYFEENSDKVLKNTTVDSGLGGSGMDDMGFRTSDFEGDLEGGDDLDFGDEDIGDTGTEPEEGSASPLGGQTTPPPTGGTQGTV
jgi:hypothetical protein